MLNTIQDSKMEEWMMALPGIDDDPIDQDDELEENQERSKERGWYEWRREGYSMTTKSS